MFGSNYFGQPYFGQGYPLIGGIQSGTMVLSGGAVAGGEMSVADHLLVPVYPSRLVIWHAKRAEMELSGGAVCGGAFDMRGVHDSGTDDLIMMMMSAAWDEDEVYA